MALRFVAVSLAVAFVAQQANAGCLFEKLACLSKKATCQKDQTSFPYIPTPTKTTQHPDVDFTVAIPQEIPLGNHCQCRKYAVVPKIVPVDPAPTTPAPAYGPAYCPAYGPAYGQAYGSAYGSTPACVPAYVPAYAPACAPAHAPAPTFGHGFDMSSLFPSCDESGNAPACDSCE